MAAPFFQCLLKNLPAIIGATTGLINLWRQVQGSKEEDDKVMKAMILLRDHQDDIDRFIEDPERQRVLMEGYSILVRRVEELQQRRAGAGAGRDQGFRNYGGDDFVPRRPVYHERDNGYAGKEDYRGEFRGRDDYGWRDDSRGRNHWRGDDRGGDYVGDDMRRSNDYRRMDDRNFRRREQEDERQRQDNDGKSAKKGGNLSKIKGQLVCDVCTELYDTDYRRPMLLPTCGHTFCRACLRKISQERHLRCPVCRSDPFTDVNSLPTNLPLLSLITEEDGATGGSCEDNGNACHEDSSGRSNNGDCYSDNMIDTGLSFEVQLQLALMLSSEKEGVNQDNSNPFAFLNDIEMRNTHDLEDDDLQLALAMSMEESQVPCQPRPLLVTRVEEQTQQTGNEAWEVDNDKRQVEMEREEIRKEKENLEREKEEWKKKMNRDRARKTIADLCSFREDPCNEDEDCCDDDDESCEEEDEDCKEQECCTEEECCSDSNMGNDNPYTDTSCYMPEEASNNVSVDEEEKLRKKKKKLEWRRKKEQEQIELAMALSLSLQDQNPSST